MSELKLINNKVACVIPSYNGISDLTRLIDSLFAQDFEFDILIVDSSSNDGTVDFLREKNISFRVVKSADFNHGATRQMMVDENPSYEFYVFLTQDACLENNCAIKNIISPFSDAKVGAVCGRQLPHLDASLISAHARFFNYPDISEKKGEGDIPRYGIKTAFLSNSFAAYRAAALADVGGFPSNVILSEDMWVAAKMIINGWVIFYSAEAVCRHSHNYTIFQEFSRYFDIGVFHGREPWIKNRFGGAGGEGLKFVLSELSFIGWKRFYLYPEAIFRDFVKLLGYKIGSFERFVPNKLGRFFSMHKKYWV